MGHAAKMQKASDLKQVMKKLVNGYMCDIKDGETLEYKVSRTMRPRATQLATLSAVLYYTARRISDVLDLRWSDFVTKDSTKKEIVFKDFLYIKAEGKTGKYIAIPIHDELKFYLIRHYRARPYEPGFNTYVFKSINGTRIDRSNSFKKIQKVYASFGVKDVCHHGFRKSAARHMYEKMGRNHEALLTVQKVLNHSNPNTTLVYIGIDMKRMNDAFNIL